MTATERARPLIVIAAGFLASLVGYPYISSPFLSSAPSSRVMIALLLPATAAVIYTLFRSLRTPRTRSREDAEQDGVEAIVLWIVVFLMTLHALVIAVLSGVRWVQPWAGRAVVVLVGLACVVIGNLLPRTRPNVAVGIRTTRTLGDRRLWMVTHRITGYVLVSVGAVTAFAGAFLAGPSIRTFTVTAVVGGAAMIGASYLRLSRRQMNGA
jgi:uncharacterized membrane protein